MKRVGIYLPSLDGGGAERVMVNLAGEMARRGVAVDLVLVEAKGAYLPLVPDRVRIIDLHARRALSSLPGLVRYLRRERPQALITALAYTNVIAVWAKKLARSPARVVITEHVPPMDYTHASLQAKDRFMAYPIRLFYPWADEIVTVSEGVADDLAALTGIDRSQIRTIYNPVISAALFERAADPLDHPWFAPGQPPVILGMGRLYDQKDFASLIQAVDLVRQETPCRLMILGEGPLRPALEALIAQRGLDQDVALPGFVDNPYPYLKQATLFVLSSKFEGLPTVLIEAMALDTPLVSTDCKNGPREILKNGAYGLLVPVGDVDALARAIKAALAQPERQTLPETAYYDFTVETSVDAYMRAAGLA